MIVDKTASSSTGHGLAGERILLRNRLYHFVLKFRIISASFKASNMSDVKYDRLCSGSIHSPEPLKGHCALNSMWSEMEAESVTQ